MINNCHSTGYFPFERGRQNEQIEGICISDHELQISAYADDANFLVSDI